MGPYLSTMAAKVRASVSRVRNTTRETEFSDGKIHWKHGKLRRKIKFLTEFSTEKAVDKTSVRNPLSEEIIDWKNFWWNFLRIFRPKHW